MASITLYHNPRCSKSREALAEVIADSDQLIKTFNALLMISRVEAGSQVAELGEIDMSALMQDVAELYEPVCEEEGFDLKVEIDEDIMVRGNRELLSQALANLLDNALKYGGTDDPQTRQVTIGLKRRNRDIVAYVGDRGQGIPPSQYEKVKERFARLDESRTLPGNGLGLALVDAIAKLHEGRFELDSAEPGLRAELILPGLNRK